MLVSLNVLLFFLLARINNTRLRLHCMSFTEITSVSVAGVFSYDCCDAGIVPERGTGIFERRAARSPH